MAQEIEKEQQIFPSQYEPPIQPRTSERFDSLYKYFRENKTLYGGMYEPQKQQEIADYLLKKCNNILKLKQTLSKLQKDHEEYESIKKGIETAISSFSELIGDIKPLVTVGDLEKILIDYIQIKLPGYIRIYANQETVNKVLEKFKG
jgi:hypothetical protein